MRSPDPFQSLIGTVQPDLTKLIESISLIELVTPDNLTAERRAWLERAEHDVYTDPLFVYNVPKLVACAHKANRLKNYGRQVLETQKPENAIDEAILKILRRDEDYTALVGLHVQLVVTECSGILMGLGYALAPGVMGVPGAATSGAAYTVGFLLVKAGGALIDNMAWLFAIGAAVGLADNDGTAGLAGR